MIVVNYRKYANANSRVRLTEGRLFVDISDLLRDAPAPIQEALATILISKLFRKTPEKTVVARYRKYFARGEVQRVLEQIKQQRGRKLLRHPTGKYYNLLDIFEDLNLKYFHGLMARPDLGWSVKPSRTVLGHYDPSHHAIVLTNLLDSQLATPLIVSFVMFHEMLHLRYPTESRRSGRRCVHTPAFKAAERTFEEYARAKTELRMFVEALN